MAVLARRNFTSQARLDLQDLLAEQSFTAYDFRAFSTIMQGLNKNYVVRGLEISGVSGLTINVSIRDSVMLCPLDNQAAFYVANSDDQDVELLLPPSTENVFVEAYLERDTSVPVSQAIFDPGATTSTTPAGSEFTAAVDFQAIMELKFRFKTDAFSADAIPVAKFKTSSVAVTEVTDSRNMFFRLGSGGPAPDQFNRYEWSTAREENLVPGDPAQIGQLNVSNPYFVTDANGSKNDKAIKNLKEWMDAMMTVIAEIKGTPTWYFPANNKTIPNLLFLTGNATSIVPQPNRIIQWSRAGDVKLRTKGTGDALQWSMNFGYVKWTVGGAFVSSTSRAYASNSFECTVADGRSVFLRLERETRPSSSSGNSVKWGVEAIASIPAIPVGQTVKGQEGDFIGVAVGDYVRKEGDDYFEYNRIIGVVENGVLNTTNGYIATSATAGLQVENTISSPSTEPFRWFRSAYSQEDLFVSTADGLQASSNSLSPLTIAVDDINMYWIGRRAGNIFLFRDYGNMQPGEEVPTLDDESAFILPSAPLHLRLDKGAYIDSLGNFTSLNASVLTIDKRKTDNLVDFGSGNTDAWQNYTIASSQSMVFSADEAGLWVRLDDQAAAVAPLVSGLVEPAEPTVPTLNVLEVLPVAVNPKRSLRNANVYLIARRVTIDGVVALQFFDGTVVKSEGISIGTDVSKVVSGVATSVSGTTAVVHGFQRNTKDFVWSAKDATDVSVHIGGVHQSTGLLLDATPGGIENLSITFVRHLVG
jgi:hypothetical protein